MSPLLGELVLTVLSPHPWHQSPIRLASMERELGNFPMLPFQSSLDGEGDSLWQSRPWRQHTYRSRKVCVNPEK